MKLEGIGTLKPAVDADRTHPTNYKPTVLPALQQEAPIVLPSVATPGGTVPSNSRSRRSRATKGFFGHASPDVDNGRSSVASTVATIDPKQSLRAYLASHRGRGDFEQMAVRARSVGIPSATCFKDLSAALLQNGNISMAAQQTIIGSESDLLSVSSKSSARSGVPRIPRSSVGGGSTLIGDVDDIAEEMQELRLSPTQAYVEQAPSQVLETGFLGEHYVSLSNGLNEEHLLTAA